MKKITYTNTMSYIYNAERKGAKYSLDNGATYKNHGELCESIAKFHRGYDYLINPATSYDEDSDIREMNASVKSSGASLACIYGNSFDSILNIYFNNVHSNLWIYVTVANEEVTEYHMNEKEFRKFCETWGNLVRESGTNLLKIRLKKESNKMLNWLDNLANEN